MLLGQTSNGLPVFHDGQHPRILACMPPDKPNRLGAPRWQDSNPILPRSEWFPVNNRQRYPWIEDQNGYSSCVANASAAALRRARAYAGCEDVRLSPGFLYSLINGGQDQGAVISEAADKLLNVGTCSYAVVGETPIYTPQMPAQAAQEAPRFRAFKVLHLDSFDAIASAILLNRIVVYGIMVGDNFMSFDKYGVAGFTQGPGNHAMHADGLALLPDGRWVLDDVNSWALQFGPWGNGRCYLDEEHIAGVGSNLDAYALEAPQADPQDSTNPPMAHE